jgi:hypothetical protein
MENYTYIHAYNNENNTDDFSIKNSRFSKTNGEYTLVFVLEDDTDGVIATYYFFDLKSKVRGTSSSPWDFKEFTDTDEEYTDHKSIEDFGFKSDDISNAFVQMEEEFIKKYLNEESQERLLDKAAVPFSKRGIMTKNAFGNLIFEEGDSDIYFSTIFF